MEEKKYIWRGSVGAKIQRKINGSTREQFHSFEFVRCYKTGDSEEMKYTSVFTERNAKALEEVLKETLQFITTQNTDQESESKKNIVGKISVAKIPANEAITG